MRVHVQPCGSSVANEHYVDTIDNPVPVPHLEPFLTSEQKQQLRQLDLEAVAVWGVTPGKRGQNRTQWLDMGPGDLVLLYRAKRFFQSGTVLFTLESEQLAESLWSRTDEGETWQCIYVLVDLVPIDISITDYNEALGYNTNNVVQGYRRFDFERSVALLDELDLSRSDKPTTLPENASITERLAAIRGDTNTNTATKARREQTILREHLFQGRNTSTCDLCGKSYPTRFLVCAHIKKRANCSEDERTDLNVVMSACRFGCDELYEAGYIFVSENGVVDQNTAKMTTPDMSEYVSMLLGNRCQSWNEKTAKYFDHHRSVLPR